MRKVPRAEVHKAVQNLLWARSAGRCQFRGCNSPLWKDPICGEPVNLGQKSHIYSYSKGGTRGQGGRSSKELNKFDNLLLTCPTCHKTIDESENAEEKFPVELVQQWKEAHIREIERQTGFQNSVHRVVVTYGARIGSMVPQIELPEAYSAMWPDSFPHTEVGPIDLSLHGSVRTDSRDEYWANHVEELKLKFDRNLRERLEDREKYRLAVFGLAPQPLLVLLGSMLTELVDVHTFPRLKTPTKWGWDEVAMPLQFEATYPEAAEGEPVLAFSISGKIDRARIAKALGIDCFRLWEVAVPEPGNDIFRSKAHLADFKRCFRAVLEHMRTVAGLGERVHLFPALPAALAIEVGRLRGEKIDGPWQIWDHIEERGGFAPALTIGGGNNEIR